MGFSSSEGGFSGFPAQTGQSDLTLREQSASHPRRRLQRLVDLDERNLIDLVVEAEFGELEFGMQPPTHRWSERAWSPLIFTSA